MSELRGVIWVFVSIGAMILILGLADWVMNKLRGSASTANKEERG